MKITSALLVAVSTLALAGAAHAADLVVIDEPVAVAPAAHDWSGAYVGGSLGFGTGTVDWTGDFYDAGTDAFLFGTDGSFDISGWTVGVQAGANVQLDMFVLGVEGDISWANIAGEGAEIDPQNAPFASVPSSQLDWLGTLRGRAGVAVDQVLLYGTAGFAFAGGSMAITNLDGPGDDVSADITATGWTAGVGAEVALDDNISVKAEYLYTSLTSDEQRFDIPADTQYLLTNSDIALHTFKVGLNFSF